MEATNNKTNGANNMTTFKANTSYLGTNGSPDYRFEVQVLSRTAKTVTIKTRMKGIEKKRIKVIDNEETFLPFGNHSMRPQCRANKTW